MKTIILAAGRGSRLSKYTEELPKGMLPLMGKPLLQWQVDFYKKLGCKIIITRGYKKEKINFPDVKYYDNPYWENSNQLVSAMCALDEFDGSDDILITYADTLHEPRIIKQLIHDNYPLSKAIDTDYKDYWTARLGSWQEDSESCVLAEDGSIIEIGEEDITDPNRLHGRDASATFIRRDWVLKVKEHYQKIKETNYDTPLVNGKCVRMFNMTDWLQSWIKNGWAVKANKIQRGWMEFDTNEDYELAQKWIQEETINRFIDIKKLK